MHNFDFVYESQTAVLESLLAYLPDFVFTIFLLIAFGHTWIILYNYLSGNDRVTVK